MKVNCLRISVNTTKRLRLIKNLADAGVVLKQVENQSDNVIKFTIKSSDKQKTFAILKKLCYNYSVEWDCGIKSLLSALKMRLGVAIGALIAVVFCVLVSQTVFFVKIIKVEYVDDSAVKAAVMKSISLPALRNNIDLQSIRKNVLSLDGIAMCEAEIDGNNIVVRAIGASDGYDSPAQNDIVSQYDAIVTKVIAKKGTITKKPGDIVKKGDVLISGEIMSSDGAGVLEKVQPEGEVWGKIVYRANAAVPSTYVCKRRTGNVRRRFFVTYGNLRLHYDKPFDSCDVEIKSSAFGLILPLRYTCVTFYETAFEETETDTGGEAEELLSDIKQRASGRLLETKIMTENIGGGYTLLRVYAVYESKIS